MTTQQFICANWSADNTNCKKFGNYTCNGCHLVVYCSSDCQKSHWNLHKVDCKSSLGKKTWNPNWVLENRRPDFMKEGVSPVFGGSKFLWGNVPAFDVLQLGANEGDDYVGPMNLLFAASGDPRNIVKTIAQLSGTYNKPINVTINDRDLHIVARNVIILLIALIADNIDEAVDCIIHIWYSILIRKSDLDMLQQRIRPLLESVYEKIKRRKPDSLLGKTWTFGQRSLRLVLQKSSWDRLLAYMTIPEGLTAEQATHIYMSVTLAESRKDNLEQHSLMQSPSRRIAIHRFRREGLLLPFGSPRHEFQEPNPTFFHSTDDWPMNDDADPLTGWSSKDVEDTSSGPATADIYGKLFYYLREVLQTFILRLSNLQISFELFQKDFSDLPDYLELSSFSRIEVSNVSDSVYVGVRDVVSLMVPYLQGPAINPHATLITLFMNAVLDSMTDHERMSIIDPFSSITPHVFNYLPLKAMSFDAYSSGTVKMARARSVLINYDPIFDRYMKDAEFSEIEQIMGVEMKEKHTVIEKWPRRLKLQPGQPGAQEEFNRLVSGHSSTRERYVEWRRICLHKGDI